MELLSNIYNKNLNADQENQMGQKALIMANKNLYESTGKAIREAAKLLGVSGIINLHVFSNKKNPKIPKKELHLSLRDGGAESVEMDEDTKLKYDVQSNDGTVFLQGLITHIHLAKFRV